MVISDSDMVEQVRARMRLFGLEGFDPYTVQDVIRVTHGRVPVQGLDADELERACQRSLTWKD